MKHGDFIMTAATLIAENGEEVPVNSVGEMYKVDGKFKIAVKHKGEVVLIGEYGDKDIVEIW